MSLLQQLMKNKKGAAVKKEGLGAAPPHSVAGTSVPALPATIPASPATMFPGTPEKSTGGRTPRQNERHTDDDLADEDARNEDDAEEE